MIFGPKMAPGWHQDDTKAVQDGPGRPKGAPRWPEDGPRWPKMAPRWPQVGPKMGQTSVFQGFPTSKPKKGDPRPISDADLGRFWDPLGAHVGPMLGPVRAQKAS